jgi:hypothetical protein
VGTALTNKLVALVADQFGNPVSGVNVTFAPGTGGGTVSPSGAQQTAANGQVSVTATLGASAGTQTFTATSSGLSGSPLTYSETANSGPPASITLANPQPPSSATVGSPVGISVLVTDSSNNPLSNINVSFTKTAGNGSIPATPIPTASNGIATATATLDTIVGTNTFEASVAGVASKVAVTVTGIAGTATQLVKISGDGQTGDGLATLALPLVVEARDQFGNVKSGVPVTFAVTSGDGTVSPTTSQNTGTNGRAQATAKLGTTNAVYTFTASSPGLSPATFSETALLSVTPTLVDVLISSGSMKVGSYQVTIGYDKNLVQLTADGVTGGAAPYDSFAALNIDSAAGTVAINKFTTANVPSGNFAVAHLAFKGIKTGTFTLTKSNVVVTDEFGNNVDPNFLSLSTTTVTVGTVNTALTVEEP